MSARLRAVYERVTSWQRRTFPNQTAASILAHMRLELAEIEAAPNDIEERADMAILAMGVFDRLSLDTAIDDEEALGWAWGKSHHRDPSVAISAYILVIEEGIHVPLRHVLCGCTSGTPSLDSEEKFLDAIEAKMTKNEDRRWPAPADQVPGQPVEHLRDEDLNVDAVIAALTPAPPIVSSEVDLLRARVAELEAQVAAAQVDVDRHGRIAGEMAITIDTLRAERAEWRADNERLREERRKIRMWLQAVPHEGAVEAVHRLIREANALRNREGGR